MLNQLSINNRNCVVDLESDPYGKNFWKNFEDNQYEPDTLDFLRRNLTTNSIFFDIGAANGAITLFAATLGCKVFSYDPNPSIYSILKRNVELNPELTGKVKVFNVGISNVTSTVAFSKGTNRKVFSDIALTGVSDKTPQRIAVHSLSKMLEAHSENSPNTVIKMDIEGAEWKILNDTHCVKAMQKIGATLLLAVHPGFYRQEKSRTILTRRIWKILTRLLSYAESIRTYKSLSKAGTVSRTNYVSVPNASKFALLIMAGYYEFIVDFGDHKREL
jgi:FkbM family methyltransferase